MARDYIMRMVEQIAAILATILAKKELGQISEARQEIDGHCLRTIGLTIERLKQLSPEALAELLSGAGAMRPIRAVTLAELLLVDADLEGRKAVTYVSADRLHAFCLLADVVDALNSEDQAVYRERLKSLAQELAPLRNHPYIATRLSKLGL